MKTKIEAFKKESTEDLNHLLNSEKTPATEKAAIRNVLKERESAEKEAPLKIVKKDEKPKAKKATVIKEKPTKKEAADKKIKAKEPKKPGVIATIFSAISDAKKPVTEVQILAKLTKAFPDKNEKSLGSTMKVQIGSNKRPVRMEREKKVTFKIETSEKGVKSYSL